MFPKGSFSSCLQSMTVASSAIAVAASVFQLMLTAAVIDAVTGSQPLTKSCFERFLGSLWLFDGRRWVRN